MRCEKNKNIKAGINTLLLSIFSSCLLLSARAQTAVNLFSPDRALKATISLTKEHQLQYTLSVGGKHLVSPSRLGIMLNNYGYGSHVVSLTAGTPVKVNGKYPITGKHAFATNMSRDYTVGINERGIEWILAIRMFNDGLAFRYEFTGQNEMHVDGESSSFALPKDSQIWYFERNNAWKLKTYAGEWVSAPLKNMLNISTEGPVQGKPLVAQLGDGRFLAITEAGLYNYSGLRFKAINTTTFQADFTEGTKGFNVRQNLATPWRVVMYARNLNQLVNSDIIANLNPKPDGQLFKDRTYIKPGRAVWSWGTKDTAYLHPWKEMQFIDYAANLTFEYSLIDDPWEKAWPDKWGQLKKLCDYALKKNVRIWVWKHADEMRDPAKRKSFLDSIVQAGVVGVKVDYMNSEAKLLIDFDIDLLKDAAERKLMVILHGCESPTGESKTYPNELNREAVRGIELNGMKEGPLTAAHNAALPFTRYITGHADYTPALFSNPGNTTWGQQLACLYLFDSPFLCMAEDPGFISSHEGLKQIVPLLKKLPVTWDESVVLPNSKIGKLAAIAKRKGREWYITVINGENIAKAITINTSFIKNSQNYRGLLYNDGKGNAKQITVKNLSRDDMSVERLTILLEPNGGLVMALSPVTKNVVLR